MKKKKVFVLMVSKYFPKSHQRAGEETGFRDAIERAILMTPQFSMSNMFNAKSVTVIRDLDKIHTIRSNHTLWSARAEKINRGEAVLSLRQWSGKHYRSKQEEFLRLEKVCVQKISVGLMPVLRGGKTVDEFVFEVDGKLRPLEILAKNDGLSEQDMCGWFKIPFSGAALINFTEFKY